MTTTNDEQPNGTAREDKSDVAVISDEEFKDFKEAIREHHARHAQARKGDIVLRAFCVCGYPDSPGPPACSALEKLLR